MQICTKWVFKTSNVCIIVCTSNYKCLYSYVSCIELHVSVVSDYSVTYTLTCATHINTHNYTYMHTHMNMHTYVAHSCNFVALLKNVATIVVIIYDQWSVLYSPPSPYSCKAMLDILIFCQHSKIRIHNIFIIIIIFTIFTITTTSNW